MLLSFNDEGKVSWFLLAPNHLRKRQVISGLPKLYSVKPEEAMVRFFKCSGIYVYKACEIQNGLGNGYSFSPFSEELI